MKRVLALLSVALAGCVTEGDLFQRESVKLESPTSEQTILEVPHATAPTSPAAKAAASSGANLNRGELLDCVTESCRINCSSKVKKQFQPKWCARFKEPALE